MPTLLFERLNDSLPFWVLKHVIGYQPFYSTWYRRCCFCVCVSPVFVVSALRNAEVSSGILSERPDCFVFLLFVFSFLFSSSSLALLLD